MEQNKFFLMPTTPTEETPSVAQSSPRCALTLDKWENEEYPTGRWMAEKISSRKKMGTHIYFNIIFEKKKNQEIIWENNLRT